MTTDIRRDTDRTDDSIPAPARAGILLVTYALTVLAVAVPAVGLAVGLSASLSPSLPVQLGLWLVAIAGVSAAPAAGRRAVTALASRLEAFDGRDAAESLPEPGVVAAALDVEEAVEDPAAVAADARQG